MTDVTLSRAGTSVSFPLVEEGGEILAARTFGKPEVRVRSSGGSLNPRVQDNFSGLESVEVVGKIFDLSTAHDLADLIKSSSVDPLTVAIDAPEYPDTLRVAPAAGQASALSLEFPAGRKGLVNVDLSLTRVGNVFGIGGQTASTPRASGSGPVVVSVRREDIELPTADLSLSRTVGRPNDAVRRVPSRGQTETRQPRYQVKNKVAADSFSLSFETIENIPETLNALTDAIFRQQLGRKGLAVDFNGFAGLGKIRAIPIGSSPFRQVRQAGRRTVTTPTLEFRRILDVTN
jgi:hypothetical protein